MNTPTGLAGIDCAWCQHTITPGPPPISHSICPPCAECVGRTIREMLDYELVVGTTCREMRRHLRTPPTSACPLDVAAEQQRRQVRSALFFFTLGAVLWFALILVVAK